MSVILWSLLAFPAPAATMAPAEPPPDPGFETSVQAADVIAEVEIIAGGPFRAVAQARKVLKGSAPAVFELEGFNSYQWDTVHQGFATGSRYILFLSRTGKPDLFAPLTPAAPRLSIQPEGVLLTLGDPPFRIPIKKSDMEDALALLVEAHTTGKVPERAAAFTRSLWEAGDIEPRYLAVALAGALRDTRCEQLLIDASKDKLLKLRLTALDALGKAGTPQALAALRALLKDEKATLAREAARALVARRDVESLPELLAWVRRNADSAAQAAGAKKTDANQTKSEAVMNDVLAFAADAGPLLEPDALARPLFELVRSRNEKVGRGALSVLIGMVQAPQIPTLLELADDRTCDLHFAAAIALQQITLAPFRDTDEFRSWWAQSGRSFGEDFKRELVESAAKAIAQVEPGMERRSLAELIRMAPGDIALVSAAPLLMKTGSTVFSAADVAAWDSPLAVPFLLERLGRDSISERRDALEGLARFCGRHPRLKTALWPLVRAGLAEEDSTRRRAAQAAAGRLSQADGVGALLDAVQYGGGYEGQEAGKALYSLTARTLGFSVNEPIPDQNLARLRLRGWW
ncbi:MAG: HEAT repeat domain-containing protein, partial [Planctomycetota bacterium]|nr:HEAT repeat domain-containing protein [Planctomycetota bacterium]